MDAPKINIRRIASECGVSAATVSRVLNNKPDVSESIRKKIWDAVKSMNYSVRLSVAQTDIIGVTVEYPHAFSSPYVSALFNALEDTAFDLGYDLLVLRNERLRRSMDDYGIFLKRKMLAGVIVLLSTQEDAFPLEIASVGFPHIVVNNRFEGPVNYVDADWYQGAHNATRYLLSQGHASIAFLHQSMKYFDNQERMRGYRDALTQAGYPVDPDLLLEAIGDPTFTASYNGLNTLLQRRPDITAMIAQNGDILGIRQFAHEHGIMIPTDFSVVAFDDSPEMAHSSPSITVVAQRIADMGELAVREVVRQIQSPEEAGRLRQTVFPTQLILRESTAPVIAKAVFSPII
jgi:LacI family transcriptional regulator